MDEKYVKVDDIVEYCNTYSVYLQGKGQGVAQCALRYVKEFAKENATDVQPVVDTENMATVSDEFICKKCGIYLIDYSKVVLGEGNEELHYEYEPKFCPECGAKVKDGDAE